LNSWLHRKSNTSLSSLDAVTQFGYFCQGAYPDLEIRLCYAFEKTGIADA